MRITTLVLLVGVLFVGCSRQQEPASELSVSYVFERSDGVVLRDRFPVQSIESADEVFPMVVSAVGSGSGRLVLELRLLEGGVTVIESDVADGKTEGPCRMYLVAEGRKVLVQETTFVGDHKHGPTIAYFPGEGVMYAGAWDMDRKTGEWSLNYRYGGRAVNAHFQDGRYDGRVQIFDAAGQEIADGVYDDGNPVDGTFIDDPWALGRSAADYGDYFATRRFRCSSGARSEEEEIEILKKRTKAAQPGATDNPDDAQRLREDH